MIETKKIETREECFPHLGEIPPLINDIAHIDTGLINEEQLSTLNDHLSDLQEKFPNSKKLICEIAFVKSQIGETLNNRSNLTRKTIMDVAMNEKQKIH